jgi:hypothetical protein
LYVRILFKINLKSLFVSRTIKGELTEKLQNILNDLECDSYSVFLGTIGDNRKIIIAIEKTKKVKYFLKIPIGINAQRLLIIEENTIHHLDKLNIKSIIYPRTSKIKGFTLQENIKPDRCLANKSIRTAHVHFCQEIIEKTLKVDDTWLSTANSQLNRVLRDRVMESIDQKYVEMLPLLIGAERYLRSKAPLHSTLCHGDFTPWNSYYCGHKLYVFDWEHSRKSSPLYFDIVHFIFQNGVLIKKAKWPEIYSEIKQCFRKHDLEQRLVEINFSIRDVLVSYLIVIIPLYSLKFSMQEQLHPQAFWLLDHWFGALQSIEEELQFAHRS